MTCCFYRNAFKFKMLKKINHPAYYKIKKYFLSLSLSKNVLNVFSFIKSIVNSFSLLL